MKLKYIRLSEVLTEMDRFDASGKPVSFCMKFVTANRKSGQAGDIISVNHARKCVGKEDGEVVYHTPKAEPSRDAFISRNPHHWINSTRNIIMPNGEIRKLHIRLIIEFNGHKVCF